MDLKIAESGLGLMKISENEVFSLGNLENGNKKSDTVNGSYTESAPTDLAHSLEYEGDTTPIIAQEETYIRPCPLRFSTPCKWSGPRDSLNKMIDHCLKTHPNNIFISDTQKLIVKDFIKLMPRRYFVLFCTPDNMFRLSWDLDIETEISRFEVYFIYDFGNDDEYLYELDFMYARKKVIKLKGLCYHLPKEEDIFLQGKYFALPYGMLKKYCDSQGSLTFNVRIFKQWPLDED